MTNENQAFQSDFARLSGIARFFVEMEVEINCCTYLNDSTAEDTPLSDMVGVGLPWLSWSVEEVAELV